jgi:hypothetical protein
MTTALRACSPSCLFVAIEEAALALGLRFYIAEADVTSSDTRER